MRKIVWDREAAVKKLDEEIRKPVQTESQVVEVIDRPKRNGNGHSTTKKRRLQGDEKDTIRKFFIFQNGQIGDDDCVELLKNQQWADLSIFQITGFVSYLHREAARGRIHIRDKQAYHQFVEKKYKKSESYKKWEAKWEPPRFTAIAKATISKPRPFRFA